MQNVCVCCKIIVAGTTYEKLYILIFKIKKKKIFQELEVLLDNMLICAEHKLYLWLEV